MGIVKWIVKWTRELNDFASGVGFSTRSGSLSGFSLGGSLIQDGLGSRIEWQKWQPRHRPSTRKAALRLQCILNSARCVHSICAREIVLEPLLTKPGADNFAICFVVAVI